MAVTDAWRDAWTDSELAEWISPPPCMCGCNPDEHRRACGGRCYGGRYCDQCEPTWCDCDCPEWIPDRDRLCDRCCAGLALADDQWCDNCGDRGWTA